MILVTGAGGQVGTPLVRRLRSAGHDVVPSDIGTCDLRSDRDIARLFEQYRFSAIVHLAAVLPSAFRADPLSGGEVNLAGTLRLLRAAVDSGVSRFVFGSSASVYGTSETRLCIETSDPAPDEPYGAAKLAVEKILELIPAARAMETVSLRIARVLGPGAHRTGSPWRSQMFEQPSPPASLLTMLFAPHARLSVIHVDDLARALQVLVEAPSLRRRIYNAPAELVSAGEIKRLAQDIKGWQVSLGTLNGGPEIDSTRFAEDFDFVTRPLREHLSSE
jgi:UDP-glucose 4-epimerase